MVSIELPPEIEARLELLARVTGRSKAYFVREAILEHLGDLEDLYVAECRRLDIRTEGVTPVPLDDLLEEYGMED